MEYDMIRYCKKLQRDLTNLVTGMDEYQLQSPEKLLRWKEFETGFTDKPFVDRLLKDVAKAKKDKKNGEEYKSANEMLTEYEISMNDLKKVIKAESDAESLDGGKFILSGNIKVLENGNVGRCYSRAGEMMVQCIEDAYKELGFNVPITGEYLVASSEEGWAGAH